MKICEEHHSDDAIVVHTSRNCAFCDALEALKEAEDTLAVQAEEIEALQERVTELESMALGVEEDEDEG